MSVKQIIEACQKVLRLLDKLFEERHIKEPSQIGFPDFAEYTSTTLNQAIAKQIIPQEIAHKTAEAFIVGMLIDIVKSQAHK